MKAKKQFSKQLFQKISSDSCSSCVPIGKIDYKLSAKGA